MTPSSKAVVAIAGLWALLGAAGWYAGRENDQREHDHPTLWALSETSGQAYQVHALVDRGAFIGFDLEAQHVRFPECDLPAPDTDEAHALLCMDIRGAKWRLFR